MPISNLSVSAKYLPPVPIGGPYLPGYGILQDQFPLVYDVVFPLNYYGKNSIPFMPIHTYMYHLFCGLVTNDNITCCMSVW